MASDMATVIVSGAISIIASFGSILLSHQLQTRREARAARGDGYADEPARHGGSVLQPIAAALIGFGLGWLASMPSSSLPYTQYLLAVEVVRIASYVGPVILVWRRARPGAGGYVIFLLDALAWWGGIGAGSAAQTGMESIHRDAPLVLAFGWVLCAVVGGLLYLLLRKLRAR